MNEPIQTTNDEQEEGPPVFKSWNGWYGLVLMNLVVLIVLFYLFTQVFK